ncbi:fructoselysine and glucoselysine-specific PTS system IIA component [Breznakia blatticola]|uniref:Fructoselysine and glucoselysine-specific PTS system IIA component n=1 Tax=Breznakia blatticola TaxID=1754012 RepID=A0A4R7ZHC0_9FIRM|nr:hypothetical protein [Breznakia blatticola]TDW16742.1 fructoselysine and glucoselysine-specific PTS system IIA component [Breznakia blatticola]
MKTKVLLATHGEMARGIQSAISLIVGDVDLDIMCCYTEENFSLEEASKTYLDSIDFENERLIVCTDLVGGSVNNEFFKHKQFYDFILISNVNLGLLIDLLLSGQTLEKEDIQERCKSELLNVHYFDNIGEVAFLDADL